MTRHAPVRRTLHCGILAIPLFNSLPHLLLLVGLTLSARSFGQVHPELAPTPSDLVLADLPWCDARAAVYPLTNDEAAWCDLPPSSRCPGLPQACAGPRAAENAIGSRDATDSVVDVGDEGTKDSERVEEDGEQEGSEQERGGQEDSGQEGSEQEGSTSNTDATPPAADVEEPTADKSTIMITIRRVLFGIVLCALLALLVAMLRSARRGSGASGPSESDSEEKVSLPAFSPAAIGARAASNTATTAQGWTDLAAEAAQRGDHREAWTCLATALLMTLQATGRVQLHPSRTTGDYVRRAPDPDTAALLRVVLRSAEAVHYGGQIPSEDTLAWAMDAVQAQSRRET